MSEESFTVSELNGLIHDVLTSGFPRAVWVCGEIQSYDRNKGKKHVFFELVEKDEVTHEIRARASLVIWGGVRPKIEAVLGKAENAFDLKDDIEVKFLCKVDFYSPHGAIRLTVEDIDPVYTLGKIAQDRQRLIAELAKSGALGKNRALALSGVPLRIGLVTAFDSAAYNDFMDELRKSGYAFQVFLVRAVMQGKNCADSVCGALKALERIDGLDAVVITRGGGSLAELSCFDSKPIVLAIAASRYPILTGIGHEINTSITDLAAHTSAKTPTAIARFLTEKVRTFLDALSANHVRAVNAAEQRLREEQTRLKDNALGLQNATRRLLREKQALFVRLTEVVRKAPFALTRGLAGDLSVRRESLNRIIRLRIQGARTKIHNYQKIMDFASPQKILKRGFSITRTGQGTLLRDAGSVFPGDNITTELAAGRVNSIVQKISKEGQGA